MPSDKHNSITAKAMGLIFFTVQHCFSRTHAFWLLEYVQCILHVLIPVSSFVSHSSLLTAKGVDLVVWLPFIMEIICNFIVATLIVEVLFEQFLIRNAV